MRIRVGDIVLLVVLSVLMILSALILMACGVRPETADDAGPEGVALALLTSLVTGDRDALWALVVTSPETDRLVRDEVAHWEATLLPSLGAAQNAVVVEQRTMETGEVLVRVESTHTNGTAWIDAVLVRQGTTWKVRSWRSSRS
ncbi:MAG: hypothetical protein AB4911_23915 [Oscillochloridaceae bacterium umkhey_bin13]